MIVKLYYQLDNIFLDNISHEEWNIYNEKFFIENFFNELKNILNSKFDLYNFYIFSNQNLEFPNSFYIDSNRLKVLIYLSQESGEDPLNLSANYFAIFKCYLKLKPSRDNIFNFPIGYVSGIPNLPIKPIAERDIDVFFIGNLNKNRLNFYKSLHPIYRHFPLFVVYLFFLISKFPFLNFLFNLRKFEISNLKSYILFTKSFKSGLKLSEYAEYIFNSKLVICPKGFVNIETFRHYEAMRAGSIVISEALPCNPFYDGAPYISLNDFRSLEMDIKLLLSDCDSLLRLQQASLAWYKNVLSERATAFFVVRCLNSL